MPTTTRLNGRVVQYTPQTAGTLTIKQYVQPPDTTVAPATLPKTYTVTAATQPLAPTMTTPTLTTAAITLNWTLPTDASRTGVNVYRRLSSTGVVTKLTTTALGASTVSYQDTGAAQGTTYDYFARTINASAVESVDSNVVSATLPVASVKARDVNLTFSSTTDPLIATLTGTNQITNGQLQQRVDATTAATEMRTVAIDVVDDGIVWVVTPTGTISGTGDVEDIVGILIDANNRVLLKRHTTMASGAVTYDKLEARMVEGGADPAQQAFAFPAGTNALKLGFLTGGQTVIFMASTDGGATFPTELTRRTLTTANFSGAVQVYKRLNINSGTPGVGVSITDRIYGTDSPTTTTAVTTLGDTARAFNAGTDELRFPLPHQIGTRVTFVGQVYKTSAGRQQLMGLAPNTTGGKGYFVQVEASTGTNAGMISWRDGAADVVGANGGGDANAKITLNEFDVFAVSKDMVSNTVRTHVHRYATGTWTHSATLGPFGTGATPIPATGHFYVGKGYGASAEPFGGDLALAGWCEKVMSDVEVESMVDANGVLQTARAAAAMLDGLSTSQAKLYRLDQTDVTATVTDLIGTTNQDGRSGTTAATLTGQVPLITGSVPSGGTPDVVGDPRGLVLVPNSVIINPSNTNQARAQIYWAAPSAADVTNGVQWRIQLGIPQLEEGITWTTLTTSTTTGSAASPITVTGLPLGAVDARLGVQAFTANATSIRTETDPFSTPVNPNTAPATPPTITGVGQAGRTLVVSIGSGWPGDPTNFTYAWARDGVTVAGATGSQYTLTAADVNHSVSATVTAHYADNSTLSAITEPVPVLAAVTVDEYWT